MNDDEISQKELAHLWKSFDSLTVEADDLPTLKHVSSDPWINGPVSMAHKQISPVPKPTMMNSFYHEIQQLPQLPLPAIQQQKVIQKPVVRKPPPKEVAGQMSQMARDQAGCRLLQKMLDEGQLSVEQVYHEVLGKSFQLIIDPFGNYLFQKTIQLSSSKQVSQLIDSLKKNISQVSMSMHGTRAIQKLVDKISKPQQVEEFAKSLEPSVKELIKNLNGNHVIQKCVQMFPNKSLEFVYSTIFINFVEICNHRHGCCVIQRCIDYASVSQLEHIRHLVQKHLFHIITDPFGNYVCQYVVQKGDSGTISTMLLSVQNRIVDLSTQKFSSNVIEKLIVGANRQEQDSIATEVLPDADILLHDTFGTYVLSTILDHCSPTVRYNLVQLLVPLVQTLVEQNKVKRIHSRIVKHCDNLR